MRRRLSLLPGVLVALTLAAGCGGDGDGAGSAEAFCDRVERIQGLDETLEDPFDGTVAEAAGEMRALARVAPDGVVSDVELFAEFLGALDAALAGVDADDPFAGFTALSEVADQFDEETLEAASDRFEEEVARTCGIDLGEG